MMTDENLFAGLSGLKQSETDIRHIFNRYIKILFNEKWQITDAITEWSKTLINQIQEHVDQQRKLLEEEYAKKVTRLNTARDRVLEQVSIHEQNKDTEQINQLLNQCNNVKVELVKLIYIDRPIISIQLITEEPLTQNTDECNVHKTENEQCKNKLIEDQNNNIPNINETPESKDSSLSVTKSAIDDNQSIDHDVKLESHIYSCNISTDKCPICFMIFPQSMSVHYRNLHVNEHYRDD